MYMTKAPASDEQLVELEKRIDTWLANELEESPVILDVSRDDEIPRRWYVRLDADSRDVTTIWLTLRQRTLKYETYFLPEPEENQLQLYEFLLRRNYELVGAQFGIGPENALFLTGELPVHAIDEFELDRVIGSIWEFVERYWDTSLRLGFSSRFAKDS
ncbi:MAG: hypothetical protein ACI85J_000143 [Candidatus Poriferisodalaceae bacterium]|jgi:hypothetical protein|tara:strand:- start:4810 stop:5286 length:477 start_codon:yes stop_codon:yes gene_type:complete